MSEGSTPSISIPDLATALRAAITADKQVTLDPSMLGDAATATRLLSCLGVSTLLVTTAQVNDIAGGLTVTGKASFLTLIDLDVTLTVTVPDGGGIQLALAATPAATATLQFPEFPNLTLRPLSVVAQAMQTTGTQSLSGALSGTISQGGTDVQIAIQLPRPQSGLMITQISGRDLLSTLPPGIGDVLTVSDFTLQTLIGTYVSFTLSSAQPWTLIPNSLSIQSVVLNVGVLLPSADNDLRVDLRCRAVLLLGGLSLPIALTQDASTGEWVLSLDGTQIPIPSLTDLAALFGGTDQIDAVLPGAGLGSFGALMLTDFQVRVDLAQRLVSSVSFTAAALQEWTLKMFGDVSFGRPTLALAIDGLRMLSAPPSPPPASDGSADANAVVGPLSRTPYLSFRLTSEHGLSFGSGAPSLDAVELCIGVNLFTSPRTVTTRVEALLAMGTRQIPILLSSDSASGLWILSLASCDVALPDMTDVAQLFSGQSLSSMLPGLDTFSSLLLTDLELRMNAAQRTLSSISFGIASRKTWSLPSFDDLTLRQVAVALQIANPTSTRDVTGNFRAMVNLGGLDFLLTARKDSPTAAWTFAGSQIVPQPLSLTALVGQLLPGGLPAGVPDISLVNVQASFTPATGNPPTGGEMSLSGSSAAPWTVPLGFTDLVLSNIQLALHRTVSNGAKSTSLQVRGDLAIGGMTATLGFALPGGFALSASLPAVKISDVLHALGGDVVLQLPGPQSAFFDLTLGPSTITIDATNKSASISGSINGFGAIELHVYRDANGKLGVALGLAPQDGITLPAAVRVPGLSVLNLSGSVFVFSSLYDPSLTFSAPAFAAVGTINRGFNFVTKIDLGALGVGHIAKELVPSSPLLVKGSFGPTIADLTLAVGLAAPGGRFVIDAATGLALIDPELRISPAKGEFGVAGRVDVVLDSQTLEFIGGFVVSPGSAQLQAALDGDWNNPFGINGLTARNLALAVGLPGTISLGGTLQVGQQSGTLFVKIHPTEPVLKLELDNIDLHDVLTSICDPALSNLPASVRQTLTDVRIDDVELYVAPRDTTMLTVSCPAGVTIAGTMHIWGLVVDGRVQLSGSGALKSLAANGTVSLPNLGNFLKLGATQAADGTPTGNPSFMLNLAPGQVPQIKIMAVAQVMGATSGVELDLNDSGFTFSLSGPLLGGSFTARLDVSGSNFGSNYSVYAEIDGGTINNLLGKTRAGLNTFCGDAQKQIDQAQALLKGVQLRELQLQQDAATLRQQLQAQRDADLQRLKDAQAQVQHCTAPIDALQRAVDAARATVQAERDEVNRRLAAAQRDVDGARAVVSSINNEINTTDHDFHSEPKIDFPWKPSQARDGAWFGAKMAGLYVARDAANAGLTIASRTLQAISDLQNKLILIDLDPRVAGVLAALISAQAALTVAQQTLATLQTGISLAPIDADPRLVALNSMAQVENLQCIAAQAAFDLASNSLSALKDLGNTLAAGSAFTIQKAYFSGDLSMVSGGSVRLGLEVTTPQGASSFTVGCDLKDPTTCITELINRLLGGDTGKAIAAAQQSTATAANTIITVQNQALTDKSYVNITCHSSGQLLRVVSKHPLRYGDHVSFRAPNGQYLVDQPDGTVMANSTTTGPEAQWLLANPNDLNSRAFIRFGDVVALFSQYGRYLSAGSDNSVTCRSASIGNEQRWTIQQSIFSTNDGPTGEVDTTGVFGLCGTYGKYLCAWNGGGQGTDNHNTQMQAWETFTLVAPDRTADGYSVVSTAPSGQASLSGDPACVFQIQRSGDWIGLFSVKSNLHLIMNPDLTVRASSPNFATALTGEHFRLENGAIFNQWQQRYLHFDSSANNPTQLIDGQGTVNSDDSCLFLFTAAQNPLQVLFDSAQGSGTNSSPPVSASRNTSGDQTTQTAQQNSLAGHAAAADGPAAEAAAATQTGTLQAGLNNTVAPAQQALAQADDDRRARRERAIEKAARGSSDAIDGWHDGALRFDGQSYLEAPATRATIGTSGVTAPPIIALGTSFTIEAWICPESLGSEQSTLLSKWRGGSEDELRFFITQDGRLGLAWHLDGLLRFGAAGVTSCQSDMPVKLDAWSHVAAVRDGDAVWLYIDGRRVGGTQGLGTSPLRVGSYNWRIGAQDGSATRYFVGLIDSIRIWDHALDQATLCAQRFLVSRGDEAGLLACWNFDEPSGDTAFDAGRLELHARLTGSVHRAVPGAPEGPPLSDRYLTLAGSAHAQVGDIDLFAGGTAMTIEAWVRVTRISESIVAILDKWAQAADDEFLFGLGDSGKLIFGWHTQGGTAYSTPGWNHIFSDGVVPLNRWCHVAVVRDGQMIRFYLDGAPIGSSTSADTLPLRRGAAPICIGSERGVTRHLEGSLAEVRVLRRAVSDQGLREHYRRPLVGDEPDLAALWRLDEGTGRVVRDATAGGHHGALVGPVSWPALGGPPRLVGPTRGMQFSGAQYIEFEDVDSFTPGLAVTIEGWIRVDSITEDYSSIVNKWPGENEYLFGLMASQKLVFAWHTQGSGAWPSTSWGQVFSSVPITLNRFTHVAVVRAGATASFFIDGQLAGSSDVVDLLPFLNSGAPLHIGGEGGSASRYLRGTIAGLRIWSVARTPEQLVASMSGLVSSRAPGRILDLRFDEGAGTTALDAASGRTGNAVGAPSFVPVTLPVRSAVVAAVDPNDTWWQPALDLARSCQTSGVAVATAMPEIDAALAQIQRSTHAQVTGLLAKAGYAPQDLGAAIVKVWAGDAAEVARQFCQADRPALEALIAIDAALALAAGSSHPTATSLASTAGYLAEELGTALCDAWGLDARAVAKLYLDAGLSTSDAARAVWTALGRHTLPCFSALVDALLSAGQAPAAVGQALASYFGCDASTLAHAVLRSGASADVASAAAGESDVIPAAPTLNQYYLFDTKHRLCLVAGDTYDQHVYHQSPQGRPNAIWTLERAAGGGFLIRDQKHGKCLVAGDVYDGNVYHQDPADRLNAVWDKNYAGDDSYFLVDQKHGKALVAGDAYDGNVYHQDPAGRLNARWMLIPVSELSALKEVRLEIVNATQGYHLAIRSGVDAAAAGFAQQQVACVAYGTQQAGTIPIYRETLTASPESQFHFSSRDAATAQSAGWTQTGIAFFAYSTQVVGTVPVYREESNGHYFFTTRPASVTSVVGYQRDDIAFYAYPPDAISPRPRVALQTGSGLFVNLEGSGVTGINVVAKRSSIGGAEPFQIIEMGQDRVVLQASSGHYITAQHDANGILLAKVDAIGGWEVFTRHDKATGGMSLQAFSSTYVSAVVGQPIQAIGSVDQDPQTLTIVPVPAAAIPAELANVTQTFAFTQIAGGLSHVSVARDGTVWGVDSASNIYKWSGSWQQISGALKQISVGSASQVWGVNTNSNVFRFNGSGWDQIAGALSCVAVASDGTVWGVDSASNIYKWSGSSFQQISGLLRQISVGSASRVWGVNANNDVFRFNGSGWDQIPGSMQHVSVSADGTVLGVTPGNALCIWRGGGSWEVLAKNFHQVTIASSSLAWGISPSGNIFYGRQAAKPPVTSSALVEVQEEVSIYGGNLYKFASESADVAKVAGWAQKGVAFVAYKAPQPGAVPIYKETPTNNPGSQFHFWHRTAQEALQAGWTQQEIAFHAFVWQAPGTVPVYRETVVGTTYYHFSTRSAAEALQAGFQQVDIAFYAYPANAIRPSVHYLFDSSHRLCLVAGDTYDQHVYHQSPQGRPNAQWTFEATPAGGFLIRDQKHGKCLVAGDVYDGNVYHQDPAGRLNAVWDKTYAADGSYYLVDQKHGKALVAGDVADGNVYHQDPAGRPNARWNSTPATDVSNALLSGPGGVLYSVDSAGELLLNHHTANGQFDVNGVKVSSGFGDAVRILSAADGHLYVIRTDGTLSYLRHNPGGIVDIPARALSTGWTSYSWVGVGRFGRLYGLNQNGDLLLFEHDDALNWTTTARKIGGGWGIFLRLFTGGNGILYAVTTQGNLLYYQHDDAMNWIKQAVQLGSDWANFASVLASGGGILYAVKHSGELFLYQHDANLNWLPGSPRQIASGWSVFDPYIPLPNLAAGVATLGPRLSGTGPQSISISAPNLPSGPLLVATAQGGAYPDTFALSAAAIGASGFQANCMRVDAGSWVTTWTQALQMGWLSLSPFAGPHMQCASFHVGTANSQIVTVQGNFAQPFASAPQVLLTAHGQPYGDTFVVSTSGVTTTGFSARVLRADNSAGWGQDLTVDCLAFDSLLDFAGIEAQSGAAVVGSQLSASVHLQTVSVTFARPFSQPPVVLLTPRGGAYPDCFAATATVVTAQGFQINVVRMDGPLSWGQNLQVDWLAVIPPAPGTIRTLASSFIVPVR